MKINPQQRLAAHMAAVRRYCLAEFGNADDVTCFRVATTFWLAERQDGFHRAAPADIPDLRLDDQVPVS